MSTFIYALMSGRAFTVLWEHPIPFDLLFDSPHINWSRSYPGASTLPTGGIFVNKTLVDSRDKTISAFNWSPQVIDTTFPGFLTTWKTAASPWVSVSVNLALERDSADLCCHRRSF